MCDSLERIRHSGVLFVAIITLLFALLILIYAGVFGIAYDGPNAKPDFTEKEVPLPGFACASSMRLYASLGNVRQV